MRIVRPALCLTLALGSVPLDAARALAAIGKAAPSPVVVLAQPVASAVALPPAPILGTSASLAAPGALAPIPALAAAPAAAVRPRAEAGPKAGTLALARTLARSPERTAQAYDGGGARGASSLLGVAGVAAAPAAPWVAGAAAPLLYAAHAYAQERREVAAEAPPRLKVSEVLEAGGVWVVLSLLSGLAYALLNDTTLLGPALGVLWTGGWIGMRQALENMRSAVVGGWQASHDQRYRVGSDGQLRDVRGHKYGEDRYDRYAPGPTRPSERLALRLIASGTGLALAVTAGPLAAALYGLSWTALTAAADAIGRRRAAPSGPVDDEERAYASRFRK